MALEPHELMDREDCWRILQIEDEPTGCAVDMLTALGKTTPYMLDLPQSAVDIAKTIARIRHSSREDLQSAEAHVGHENTLVAREQLASRQRYWAKKERNAICDLVKATAVIRGKILKDLLKALEGRING